MNSVVSAPSVAAVNFKARTNFQNEEAQLTEETGKIERRQRKSKNDRGRTKREVLSTLLSSFGESVEDYSENFIKEGITFRDLAALKDADLFLMGFKNQEQRESMLDLFQQLPRQDQSYDSILKSSEAKSYNQSILNSASLHLEAMRSALAAANYKLKIMPSEDVIVGDKNFASRFVLEALEELKRVTDELDSHLAELDDTVCAYHNNQQLSEGEQNKTSSILLKCFGIGSTIAVLAAIWYLKTARLS